MSAEEKFLEIYEVVLDQGLEEFYSTDIATHTEINAGNVGRTIYRINEEYDLPIEIERERPSDPSLFIVNDFIDYSEVEALLSQEVEKDEEMLFDEAREKLSDRRYSDADLNSVLKQTTEDYFNSFSNQIQAVAELKQQFEEEGLITGNTIDGWTVETE